MKRPRNEATDYSREATVAKAQNKKSTSTKKRLLAGIGVGLVVIIAAAVVWVGLFIQRVDGNIAMDKFSLESLIPVLAEPETPEEPYYVLLIGSDSRDPGNAADGRSDTIILTRVDPVTKQATLISIPRDVEIELAGYGTQKINAAFTYGGEAGAVEAVSSLCGVSIAHYVEIDFNGVVDLVNILDGIDVDVPVAIELDGTYLAPGEQHLDGYEALIMSRCRSFPTGDFIRVQNQRIVLQAVAKKVLSASVPSMPGLIEELSQCVTTDVPATDAIGMLLKLQGMDTNTMYMATIPSYPNNHDGVSYVAADRDALNEMMSRVDQGLPPEDLADTAAQDQS